MNIFKGFFDAINSAVSSALAPLVSKVEELRNKFKEGSEKLTIFSDIITIAAAGAKWLGEKIGILLKMALTPLVDKLKDGIEMLTEFYNKLGPIKDAIGWVGDGLHNFAESLKDTKPPIKEVEEALKNLAEEGPKAPQAIADAWAIAVKAFQDGSGAYKDAVTEINKEVEALKEEWKTAADERKAQIDKTIILIHEESEAVEAQNKVYDDHFASLINDTDKAIEKTKEFIVTIGDTTIEFKGAAAEVVKNADAYEKLQRAAQTLIDLDWSVFTEFEASLPNIEAGIGDMASSFVGLKGILEDNIVELENVKQSVMDISEIAAPFLEAGFLDGIKAIGSFANTLKDAGSAINTFSSLQDVSIEGCINFSRHVQDMVTALKILEDQMADLVPSFEKMDSLIDDIAVGFLGGIDINAEYGEAWGALQKQFGMVGLDMMESNKLLAEVFGLTLDEILLLRKEGDLTTFAFMKQTNAMKLQTTQLKKITDALQPYLEFMRTLNALAALSTLSIEELNNGLNSIKGTLVNLGSALSTFDLRPIMESLFGVETGAANEFTKTMEDYEGKFSMLIGYVNRFATSILTLVDSFEALTNISKSVLADQMKLKGVFEGITTVMTNFSIEMGGAEGFAQKFADGMDAMLKSAGPLISYFEDNNAAVTQFNTALLSFKTTITTVIDVFEALASVIKRSSDLVVISAKEIEDALSLVDDQLIEIGKYLQTDAWGEIVTQLSAVSEEWKKWAKDVDNSMPGFNSAADTFSTLISKILGLSSALKDMRDMAVLSVRDIDEALKNIPVFLDRFVDALALNMSAIKQSLKELDKEWSLHAEEMKDTMPSFTTATSEISTLISTVLSLNAALEELSSMGVIRGREFDRGFSSLIKSISNFAVSLAKNADELIISLQKLRVVWAENEAVLLPLMKDFAIITDNLWGVAHNANRMAEEFSNISKNSKTLEKGFKSLIDFINQVVKSTKEFYTTEAAAELATFIKDVGKVIGAFVDLERELNDAMGKIKGAISTAVGNIEGKISSLSSLIKSAHEWGANMMGAFITGMDTMSEQLAAAAMRQAGIVEEYLGASSPTKSGPLSHLDEWPRNLVQSYSGGIEAEMHTLNHSFAALAPNMGAAGPASSTKSVNIYLTQNIGNRSDADYSVAQLRREMIRHEVM
jgi:ABC-type transporter Mla subunit MlaD